MMILDVKYDLFKQFRKDNWGFYYAETPTEFVLAKADEFCIVRCVVAKVDKGKDLMFRLGIQSRGGVEVSRITFFDREKTSPISEPVVSRAVTPTKKEGGVAEISLEKVKRFVGGTLNR